MFYLQDLQNHLFDSSLYDRHHPVQVCDSYGMTRNESFTHTPQPCIIRRIFTSSAVQNPLSNTSLLRIQNELDDSRTSMPALVAHVPLVLKQASICRSHVGIVNAGTIMSVWIINTYHHTEPEASSCLGF